MIRYVISLLGLVTLLPAYARSIEEFNCIDHSDEQRRTLFVVLNSDALILTVKDRGTISRMPVHELQKPSQNWRMYTVDGKFSLTFVNGQVPTLNDNSGAPYQCYDMVH